MHLSSFLLTANCLIKKIISLLIGKENNHSAKLRYESLNASLIESEDSHLGFMVKTVWKQLKSSQETPKKAALQNQSKVFRVA